MPNGPFTRKSAGSRAVAARDINELQVALENTPTLAEAGGGVFKRLGSGVETTLATAVDIGNLNFAVTAGEVWVFNVYLRTTGNTGGIKYTWSSPSMTTVSKVHTGTLSSQDTTRSSTTSGAGAFTNAFTTGFALGFHEIHGSLVPSASGTVQFQFAAVTAGESVFIEVGSYLIARRIS